MPLRYGVKVTVTDTFLTPLTEYGSQAMGKAVYLSKIVSTRIEAKDGLQFYIRVQPQYPFPFIETVPKPGPSQSNSNDNMFTNTAPLGTAQHGLRRPKRFNENTAIEDQMDDQGSGSSPLLRHLSGPEDEELDPILSTFGKLPASPSKNSIRTRSERSASRRPTHSSPSSSSRHIQSPNTSPAYPPFDLTASVYIDGHEKPEARQVIYLNPNNPKFYMGGFVSKGRWAAPPPRPNSSSSTEDASGAHISIQNWVFKAMPISVDDLTSRMAVCSTETQDNVVMSEQDREFGDLEAAMSRETLDAGARPKTGQIEVRIRRIIAGTASSTTPFKPYHYRGADEEAELESGDAGEECTHTTALRTDPGGHALGEAVKLNTIPWKPYNKGEDVYVKFVFTYTDRAKLFKLGLCDETGRPTLSEQIRALDAPPKAMTGARKRDEQDLIRDGDRPSEDRHPSSPMM